MAYEEWTSVEKVKKYKKKRYNSFDQRIIDRLEKRAVKQIFNKFNIKGSILDIPCGYGRFHRLISSFGDIHAADNGKLIAHYQREELGISKSTTVCDAASMPFSNNKFDAVFCFRLIQHMHDSKERIAIYNEFNRVSNKWVIVSLYVNTTLHSSFKQRSKKKARISFLSNETIDKEFAKAKLLPVYSKSILPGIHGNIIFLTKKII